MSRPQRIAIVGAGGPTGIHLAHELLARGRGLRLIGRDRTRLERAVANGGVERVIADALEPASLVAAVAGCDLVVDCIGLPPQQMAAHETTARAIVRAAREAGARCLQVSSFWAFLPTDREVIDESHPRRGGHAWFRARRAAEDEMLAAGAAVVHLPDFFGPRVHASSVQIALREALGPGKISCIGSADIGRECAFVPDAMRTVTDLADHDEAYGTDWAIPGNGVLTPRELARLASATLGREIGVRAAPVWLLRLLALGSHELRAIAPLLGHYARPIRYNTAKLEALLGPQQRTPLPDAIAATLRHLQTDPAERA